MQAVEQKRKVTPSGENIAVYGFGKLNVRLIGTFGERVKLDDLLYSIACQKIADKIDAPAASLFENVAMV